MKPQTIQIASINVSAGTQVRAKTDPATVDAYAEAMSEGQSFPAVDVVTDGVNIWLTDGFHRVLAGVKLDWRTIEANVYKGTLRDAILRAAGANATHGLPRTSADKRRSVEMLLADPEWRACTDSWIAEKCGVHQTTVSRIRHESSPNDAETVRKRPDGTTVNIANRGRKKSSSKMPVAEPVDIREPKDESEEVHVHHDTIPAPAPIPDPHPAQVADYHRVVSAVMTWPKHRLEQLATLVANLIRTR